jgi:predicted CXXCH cytochrome family protein
MLQNRMDVVCYNCHVEAEVQFTKSHTHSPVLSGQCNACHRSHGAERSNLLPFEARDPRLCRSCHETLMQTSPAEVIHTPFTQGQCLECHEVHGSNIPGMLAHRQGFLCHACHGTDLQPRAETIASRHAPSQDGQCSACHSPHKAGLDSLLLAENPDLCLACHTELRVVADRSQSEIVVVEEPAIGDDVSEPLEKTLYVHAPGEIDRCGSCHRPHQSPQDSLMTASIQPLCGKCHDYGAEDFKRVHLQIDPARADCRNCHTPHVAQTPKLFKNVLHPPFARRDCKDCHLVDNP